MSQNITDKVKFDFIRYANCWEDPDLLLQSFGSLKDESVLSIASAGDNSFSLLINDPKCVLAVDINEVQLHLCELKKAAIRKLSHPDYLSFIGFNNSSNRENMLNELKPLLPEDTYEYWLHHIEQIKAGVVTQGKFEKYLSSFATKVLPLIHSSKTRKALQSVKTEKEQEDFYNQKWNTWRYRLLLKIFFSKMIMGKYGRDPEFLKEVQLKVSDYIFQKTAKHLKSRYVQSNHFVFYLLNGSFENNLPHYCRKENYDLIKERIRRVEFKKGYLQDFTTSEFKYFNLSNIFEYMDKALFKEVAAHLIKHSASGSCFAYWNLMVPRRISEEFQSESEYQQQVSKDMSEKDKCFFYNQFILDKKKA